MRKNKVGRLLLRGLFWFVGLFLLVISLSFFAREKRVFVCDGVVVNICDSKERGFLSADSVRQWVKINHPDVFGKLLDLVNTREIEDGISRLQAVESCVVYTGYSKASNRVEGSIIIDITQREPVLRVVSKGRDYYLDKYGNRIDWSPEYVSRAIVVEERSDYECKKLLPMVSYIVNDPFWAAQTDRIYIVNKEGDISLSTRTSRHRILLGKLDNYEAKLLKFKQYYRELRECDMWDNYDIINIKYLNSRYNKQMIFTKSK